MVEYELVFKIPRKVFILRRVLQILGTYNATRMGGFAKNTMQVTDFLGSGEFGDDIVITMRIQQRGNKWAPVTAIREELTKSNGQWIFALKRKVTMWLEMQKSENWRKVFFRKYGRYQIAGPKL